MKKRLLLCLTAIALTTYYCGAAENDHAEIKAEITKRHDEAVK